jgi:hypothetical protein
MFKMFEQLCNRYLLAVIKAPMRANYVFGTRIDSKSDLRRAFVADLKALKEVAQLRGDTKVIDRINGQLTSEITALKAELESLANEGIEA